MKLIELALNGLNQCVGAAPPEAVQDLAGKAKQALGRRVRSSRQDSATETNLELTEQLWQARTRECGQSPTESEEPLALVIARLAQ